MNGGLTQVSKKKIPKKEKLIIYRDYIEALIKPQILRF